MHGMPTESRRESWTLNPLRGCVYVKFNPLLAGVALTSSEDGDREPRGLQARVGHVCWTSATPTSSPSCSTVPTGATTYNYDLNGNRTSSTSPLSSTSLSWQSTSGRLICVNTAGTSCSTSSPTATTSLYSYDADGHRATSSNNGVTNAFIWDTGASQLLADSTHDYVYLQGSVTPDLQINLTTGTVDLLIQDQNANTRGVVQIVGANSTFDGTIVNYTDYDAYGNAITQSGGSINPGGMSNGGVSTDISTSFAFGAGYWDSSNLTYLVHRYLDNETGQFIGVDPLVDQTREAYVYAGDGPVMAIDPMGGFATVSSGVIKNELHQLANYESILKRAMTSVASNANNLSLLNQSSYIATKGASKVSDPNGEGHAAFKTFLNTATQDLKSAQIYAQNLNQIFYGDASTGHAGLRQIFAQARTLSIKISFQLQNCHLKSPNSNQDRGLAGYFSIQRDLLQMELMRDWSELNSASRGAFASRLVDSSGSGVMDYVCLGISIGSFAVGVGEVAAALETVLAFANSAGFLCSIFTFK